MTQQLIIERVVCGAFYQGVYPGGFSDALTGIHVPGPIVFTDATTRTITGVASMPDPIQLPHSKEVFDYKDKDRKVRVLFEVPFDRQDESPMHEAFNLALATGIIRRIEDSEVASRYPEAFAKRHANLVFKKERAATPMAELVSQHTASLDEQRLREAQALLAAGKR